MSKKIKEMLIPKSLRNHFKMWRQRRRLNSKTLPASLLDRVNTEWRMRIDDVIACPDNTEIPRHPDAGRIDGDMITMHNGIRIKALSYYDKRIMNMLVENKGVHEPQEERAFAVVLPLLPEKPVSLEMGAYWSFYSLWLKSVRPGASCHMVEPEQSNMLSGQMNFAVNGFDGTFTNAFVGGKDLRPPDSTPTISVDGYCAEKNINHLHILHSDIQGFESEMLDGARNMFSGRKVDHVFISTHSSELHADCMRKLEGYGYQILCSVDGAESYSGDGLIVACSPAITPPPVITVSKRGKG
jgi:hypothetical protein